MNSNLKILLTNLLFRSIALALICISVSSCEKDELQGTESLRGNWTVTQIKSYYGEFTENGHNGLDVLEESDDLGYFNFSNGSMEYNYTRNDTVYSGQGPWDLTASSRRQMMVFKEVDFSLKVPNNDVNFEATFGGGARNSEKDATKVELYQEPSEPGFGVATEIFLSKN